MIKEHLVSASVTNGTECICNPEVLLGTKYGLWDFENEQAPRGALIDLNAAWELFLSRQGFSKVSFKTYEHKQHEVIDGVVYEEGDTTYILKDDKGNITGASFTVKANKGPIEHIEWENGKLYLYYRKQRPFDDERDNQEDIPIHYVKDDDDNIIIDQETGQPLIYDYVSIPVIEIFSNDETRQLFPWYSDANNVVHLRDSIDGNIGHLGSFAISPKSEVYIAKEPGEEKNRDLVNLQSAQEQLNKDLGFEPEYTLAREFVDPDDNQYHDYKVTGSNLNEKLHEGFGDKTSLVNAINEDLVRTRINTRLMADKIVESNLDWQNLLEFSDSIRNQAFRNSTIPNLLDALNWIQEAEIGLFKETINPNIKKDEETVNTITDALNVIFQEAEENRDRIGFDRVNKQWIALNTDKKNTLTEAINEIDQHENALADIVQVSEQWDPIRKKTYYTNPDLNNITKNRLRFASINKDDVTIVEAINEVQDQIGNLSSSKSNINSIQLTTDNKNTLVEAINEVDLHADNNEEVLGAEYTKDVTGKKNSNINNLTTANKSSIVASINELDSDIGDLSGLSTDNRTNIVQAINEVIREEPFIYEDVNNLESGVVLKNNNNHAGRHSLALGKLNDITDYSLANGSENTSQGYFTLINGNGNTSKKKFNIITGKLNNNDGNYNLVNGLSNIVKGDNNIVSGTNNNLTIENSVVLGDNILAKNANHLIAAGNSLNLKDNTNNNILLGNESTINGDKSVSIGSQNITGDESVSIGINNESEGTGNIIVGNNNYVGCEDSYTFGNSNTTEGDNSYVVGENNKVTGNFNYTLGKNQTIEGNNNTIISAKNKVRGNNAIVIGEIDTVHDNSTHIGGENIYIKNHETESILQELIFVDLNDWCKQNNAASLNGEKFLDTQHLINASKSYKFKEYSESALLRFTMQNNNESGFIIIQGKSSRIYLNGTWYYTDNIENGWSRKEGEYLKIIEKEIVNSLGNSVTKKYLVLMDQNTTEAIVDTTGAQRSNSEDIRDIDLTHAYGAVDIDDFDNALNLVNRFNRKVDKTAQIITKHHNLDGSIEDKPYNFVNPDNSNLSGNITLDLEDSFGFNPDNYQLKGERGEPNGYVPLNAGGLIDAQYLPSFVDDVIEVWAEYQIEDPSGAIIDIHLYKLETQVVPTTGQEIYVKGQEILEGESGKIYIESNPSAQRRFAAQFRWSGHQFTAIGFSNITIGEVEGTAYDGAKGKALADAFEDHKNSGTTQIPVDNGDGTSTWVTYKPNPHNVKANQLDIIVNDPNDPRNLDFLNEYTVEYTVDSSIKELFRRINNSEDSTGAIAHMIGSAQDFATLDSLDDIAGNDAPTLVSLALNNKDRLDDIDVISDSSIDNLVDTYFNLGVNTDVGYDVGVDSGEDDI